MKAKKSLNLARLLPGLVVALFVIAAGTVFANGQKESSSSTAQSRQPVLKIGVDGVMSGPEASWGLVNKYSAETTAAMINANGGWKIGNKTYKIEIVALDTRGSAEVAAANAEKLTSMGIKYIIGPNVDTTAAAVMPVMQKAQAMDVPYAFSKKLYTPPYGDSILGMVASYQAAPVIYQYLKDKKGVKTIAFLARDSADPLSQMKEGIVAAKELGLTIVSSGKTYEPGTTDFAPVLQGILAKKPDLLVLSGVAPADAPLIIKNARDMGFKGFISTETSQDAKILEQVAGPLANGFISVGGASTPSIQTPYMKSFVSDYTKRVGEWNNEAGTKVYALEMILRTLQAAGPAAIDNVALFQKEMSKFETPNPFVKGNPPLKYVGTKYFGQQRQIGVPMVINKFENGKFVTLFVGSVK